MNLKTMNDLKPAPYNPRKISDMAGEKLWRSLSEFGDISGITWNERTGHLVTGHQRVERLKRHGVEPISAKDQLFDPALHEAMAQIEVTNAASGHVAQVTQTGYTIDGELLRPAQVIVAA